jgi:uncharacterized protein YfaS (alpha-2-macroglobulin family)
MELLRLAVMGLMVCIVLAVGVALGRHSEAPGDRESFDRLFQQGNYKDAYEGYQRLALDPKTEPDRVGADLTRAIECLVKLGRDDETDAFREAVIAVHPGNWRLLQAAAEGYLNDPQHFGFIVAGKFHRGGHHRVGGRYVGSYERDRSRAVQLLVQGVDRARSDPDRGAVGRYFLTLAQALMGDQFYGASWRLQSLTPLDVPADYDERGYEYLVAEQSGAPVEPDGTPVYYRIPESFEKAKNDGQRWRWALAQAVEVDARLLNRTRSNLAHFLLNQFGTQTLVGSEFGGISSDDRPEASGAYALETLKDDETIARLAIGIKRFKLPDEFNPIKIFQTIDDDPSRDRGEEALIVLARIFQDRRQFDRAADYLRRKRDVYGDINRGSTFLLDQILGAWGQFDAMEPQAARRGAAVDFRFRNGRRVHFEAHEILFDKLLKDAKDYLSSRPLRPVDWQRININDIGSRLVHQNQKQYLGLSIAQWDLDLEPLPGHFDKRITVTTPLQKAGAYLLTAHMENGNTSQIVVWLDDTIIVKKSLLGKAYYFVADARNGQPVPRADVELFGWHQVIVDRTKEIRVETKALTLKTDEEGQLQVPIADLTDARNGVYQWIITTSTPDGRLAHLGFANIWALGGWSWPPNEAKVYTITDRPVYRPGAPVRFKFWVARNLYEQPDVSEFAGATFTVQIQNPRGDKVFTKDLTADAFGGFDDLFELPSDAMLGVYQFSIPGLGGGSFRVEEYKKPEFEVNVEAPTKPVMLGEKVSVTIHAKYYFGGPVAAAKVKYKITRTTADARWYPAARWDWLFGPGYWWFAADSTWYPGWSRWGMHRPVAWWWGGRQGPPEVVAEAEQPIRPDGTLPIEIDTALAKAAHPDHDHRYEITAEITDQSRRTIVRTGTVLVARKPFTVYTWVDRGHYRTGDTIEAGVRAQTLARKPVVGKGTLTLLKIAYDSERRPVETTVESWDLTLDANGQTRQTIKAAAPGQYRLASTIDDGQGHVIEGGYLLTITGQGFDGASFRFNDLEVIPEKKEYRPGETLRLLINTNQVNSTVLLFVRPMNGVYLPPKVVHLRGKSAVEEIGVVLADMPNIFVEALTVANGKVYDEAREVAIPPESRVVDVSVEPSQKTYKPGQKAKVKVKLTGPDKKPFLGSTVVAVYDKAVEYISGGSNVADIKEFFWKWKRSHQPQTESSLNRRSANLTKPNETSMQKMGAFGGLLAANGAGEAGFGRMMVMVEGRGWSRMGGVGGGYARGAAPAAAAPARMGLAMAKSAAPAPAEPGVLTLRILDVDKSDASEGKPPIQPVIRTNFADTAYWATAIATAPDGTAEVEFPLPESLTTWKVKTWTLGPGTKVGQGESEIVTTKDLLVRIQAPRFFVEKDEVVLSANVHNKLKTNKAVQVVMEFDGSVLQPLSETTMAQTVEIAAGSEHRVDWRVKVAHEGQAIIRMKALTDQESDAAQMTFPAYVHGMLKMEAFAGTIRPDQEKGQVVLRVPAERKPDQSRLEMRYSPTLAGALVDALPYLADYPYGCTEQTLNRFLPTVITQKVLINLGLDLKAIRAKHTNLNAQPIGDARERGKPWKGYKHNPVFDEAEVARMARAGMQRLADMQLSDGGWGWFSGFGEHASAHTTALVVHGLQVARQNDLALSEGMLERGVAWLNEYQAKQGRLLENAASQVKPFKTSADDVDALVFMVLADAGTRHDAMLGFLDRDRTRLSVYAKAMFGLGLERLGEKAKLAVVLQNIGQYVVRDDENQTAYLKLPNEGYWWWWYGSEVETDAFYLKLLARTDPKGELAPRLVKYVLNNRKHGTYWNSTRDTAFCIEALAEYLKASGEDRPEMTVAIAVDGQTRKEVKITPADLFTFDNAFVLEGQTLQTGEHTVSFLKRGKGPLYFNAYLTNFTLEDPIIHAGLEVRVDRKIYRLMRDDKMVDAAGGRGQTVGQRVERYRRELLAEGATLKSGEFVEVELEIDSKNDYEYLIFEDFKAAGFEPVEVRSGYNGNDLGAYVEFHDERVAFFVRSLARGQHSVSYRLRAEIPGRFHALPARAQAMYAPELRANSDEVQLRVVD